MQMLVLFSPGPCRIICLYSHPLNKQELKFNSCFVLRVKELLRKPETGILLTVQSLDFVQHTVSLFFKLSTSITHHWMSKMNFRSKTEKSIFGARFPRNFRAIGLLPVRNKFSITCPFSVTMMWRWSWLAASRNREV